MEQTNNIANKNEPFRNYKEVEKYLQNKQVYVRKDIVNSDFKRILKGRMVYNIEYVEIKSLNKRPIQTFAFTLIIEGLEFTLYEYKTQQELFKWIKQNFIPIRELIDNRQNYKELQEETEEVKKLEPIEHIGYLIEIYEKEREKLKIILKQYYEKQEYSQAKEYQDRMNYISEFISQLNLIK